LSFSPIGALLALYDGGVRFVDDIVGQWLAEWRKAGWLEDAVVVITSDHGETLAQRGGIVRAHGGLYTDGLHIPLMIRLPGSARAGERVARPVNQVDIAPTLLELAGLEVPPYLPGVDLLSGEEHAPDHVMEARWGRDKAFVQWPTKVVQSFEEFRPQFVSDLERDFGEQDVLDEELEPATHAETLERLRAEFERQIAELPLPERQAAKVSEEMSAAERERLEALGYKEETAESGPAQEPPADGGAPPAGG
jgi:arylsulfatase A-like enzyme